MYDRLKLLPLIGALVAAPAVADSGALAPDQDVRSHNLGLGRSVFNRLCINCHSTGVLGAPRFRKPADWTERLEKGLTTLIEHTIKGHGQMPRKGGFDKLTDREVAAAVAYLVDQNRRVTMHSALASPVGKAKVAAAETQKGGCDPIESIAQCSTEELKNALLLQMLWLLAGGEY